MNLMKWKVPYNTNPYLNDINTILISFFYHPHQYMIPKEIINIITEYTVNTRHLRPFYVGQWILCLDTDKNWLEAQIEEILFPHESKTNLKFLTLKRISEIKSFDVESEGCVQIHYIGWKEKYDEYFSYKQLMNPKSIVSKWVLPYSREVYHLYSHFYDDFNRKFLNMKYQKKKKWMVLDPLDKWLAVEIIQFNNNCRDGPMVKIHFTNWVSDYDWWLPIESYRIKRQ